MSLEEIKNDALTMVCRRQRDEFQAGKRVSHHKRTEIQKVMDSSARLFALAGKFTCAALYMDIKKNRVLVAVNDNGLNVSIGKTLWVKLFSITEIEKRKYLADYLKKLIANVVEGSLSKSVYGYNSFVDAEKLQQKVSDCLYSPWMSTDLKNQLIILNEVLIEFQSTICQRHTVDVMQYELALKAANNCAETLKGMSSSVTDGELTCLLDSFRRIDLDLSRVMKNQGFKEFKILTPFSTYNFHAEMKIISGLHSEHFKTSNEINIGISKPACLMCEISIETFNDSFRNVNDPREIIVRGYHGKAYQFWSFPVFLRNRTINGLTADDFYKKVISRLCLTYQKGYVLGFEYLKDAVSIESFLTEVQSTQIITLPEENNLNFKQAKLIIQDLESLQLKYKSSGIIFFNRNVKTLVGRKKYSTEEIMSASD